MTWGRGVMDWLDERTGWRRSMRSLLDEQIRGGARWAYVFGSLLLFLLVLQLATGIALTVYYVPSAEYAHATTAYIQKAVPGGAILRGLHHYAASAMVVLAVAHLAQTFLFGAYKGKRELVWGVGVVMLVLILGFAFTGYLLPWDQAAYFGTKVGTSIAGEAPIVGSIQQRLLLGGYDLTQLTLSRFFTLHVLVLPMALLLLAVLHVALFRRARPAGPYHDRDDARIESFYPRQLFKDAIAIGICFALLVGLALWRPAELGPPADPTADYLARPPWYFLPLYQLLKYFPGRMSILPAMILPGVLLALLMLLPFIDRRAERHPRRRRLAVGMLLTVLVGAIGLTALSRYEDYRDPEVRGKIAEQEREARDFLETPFRPQIITSGQVVSAPQKINLELLPEPPAAYTEQCAFCHGAKGEDDSAPSLIGVTTRPQRGRSDLDKLLRDPRSYGLKKPMPASFPKLTDEGRRQIIDWLDSLSNR